MGHIGGTRKPQTQTKTDRHTYRGFLKCTEILSDLTRSSESNGRSDVTDSLECPDEFRVP